MRKNGESPKAAPCTTATPSVSSSELAKSSSLRIVIPEPHSMVSLLGSRDELLQVIEEEFDSDIHVRGNEITVTGSAIEADRKSVV